VIPDLSPRERQVLEAAGRGCSAGETARALDMGIESVKTHRARILLKLHAANMTEAYAIDRAMREAVTHERP
jgi:DNA-binding CsgD family transcriptional regulator